jgi:hypothetical protein
MRITRTEPVRSFQATDARGIVCRVIEMQEYVQLPAIGGADTWVPRRRSLELENGNPVDRLDDGSLRIGRTGARLHPLH